MTYIRRAILALVLAAGIAPVFAQAPSPVPALPDAERRTSYTISGTTCACAVNFALYGDSTDYQNWVEVWLNGVQVQYNDVTFGWTITSPSGALGSIARPVTDAVLTFNSTQTGTVQIVGARRPRRVSQFSESRGVAARDLNQALTDIVAQNRENWDKTNDVTGRAVVAPPGETMAVLPSLSTRASKGACFDSSGNLAPCTTITGSTFIAGNGISFTGSNPTTVASNIQAGAGISITGTNPYTVSLPQSALTLLLNTFCVASPATCTSLLGYANPIWWGADPTGAADSATAINAALTASKLVSTPPGGTYKIASSIKMQPNQRLTCNGSTITQGNGVNLGIFVDIFTNTPNGAQLDHCTINGNYTNNTNTNTILVDISGANNVSVLNNVITGSTGGAINASNSVYATIQNNYIANSNSFGVALFNTSSGIRGYHQVQYNTIVGPMLHLIQLDQVDGNTISHNQLVGQQVLGGAGTAMQVTISGTAVTWVSGATFTGATFGTVLVANGGSEFPIASVNSSTSLTLIASGGALTNVPAAIGGGDVLSLSSTSFNIITGNFVSGGATGGIVLSQSGGNIPSTESSVGNIIDGNYVENSGSFGIALEAPTAAGSPSVSQTVITNNIVLGPGRDGAAGIAPVGIQLFSAAGLMTGVLIDGNYVYDPFAVTGGFWLSGSGSANATFVNFGKNTAQGFVNGGNMSGYPNFASLAAMRGQSASIIDGLAANCGDTTCTTWGTAVTAGGGALKLNVWYNGTNWTLIGK